MIVTDVIRTLADGRTKPGYFMDGFLAENLSGIPNYLKNSWDVVGIVSGNGKVRMGKSTLAFQVGYYCAWMVAGGRMNMKRDELTNELKVISVTKPKNAVRFDLNENVVFKPEDLVEKAIALHKKYGKNQVIVYDEGREGLDSKVMDAIHEVMEDFFQKCGYMGHIILLVLPNFFKLHEDYAVARSLFLIDVVTDRKKRRGFFNFYNEHQKEWLYFLGKKRIGISLKYGAARESFYGRFSSWMPFNKEEYDALKEQSMKRKSLNKTAKRWKKQRDAAIYMLYKFGKMSEHKIAEDLTELCGFKLEQSSAGFIIRAFEEKREKDLDKDMSI